MFNYKKIIKRIKSVEEFLGLVYKAPEFKGDYEEHEKIEWGFLERLDKRISDLEKKKKDGGRKR